MNVSTLSIMGGNVGHEEIKLSEAYFLSGIDGTKVDAKIGWGGTRYKVQDINPIPPDALLFVLSDPIGPRDIGLTQDDFLKTWSIIYFVVKYNGTTQRITFVREIVLSMLPKPMDPYPHITPRNER